MLVSKILEIIRIKTADPLFDDSDEDSLFKTSELLYYLNNAIREATTRAKMLFTSTYTINAIAGINQYDVPEGVYNVIQILDEDKHEVLKIQEVDFKQRYYHGHYDDNFGSVLYRDDWRNDTNDLPYCFMQESENNQLVFYPTPDKDSILTMRANYILEDVTESDEIAVEIAEIHQRDLIYWVLYEAYGKQDADAWDDQASIKNLQLFENTFGAKQSAINYIDMQQYPNDPGSLRDY
ncbi:MAG: hypothetical protein DRP64_09800 [Verrucomicrobia bacterium]|nr:MAG: hypothetical protein DRP64_09800 [Verrucomicrobiota bacterium]